MPSLTLNLYRFAIGFSLFCLGVAGCAGAGEIPATATLEVSPSPSATTTFSILHTETPMSTESTPGSAQLVLPVITVSPREAEKDLLEMLKTNGNCTEKCIAGIRPDEMNVQDAVNKMARWGMVRVDKNSQGKTFINLTEEPLRGQVSVWLSIGTWTKEFETIDKLRISIRHDLLQGQNVWAQEGALQGFGLDSLLKGYGIPSFVGYFFQTADGTSPEGRSIYYYQSIQYKQLNLEVLAGASAYFDGTNLFLCPVEDFHGLNIEINPERPLEKLQEFSPVTWQALTGTDLDAFYKMHTTDPETCVITNIEQILTLQPDFR